MKVLIYKNKKENGFAQIIIIIVMSLVILSLLGVDLAGFFKNETLKNNFKFFLEFLKNIWSNYLIKPTAFVLGIFIEYIYKPIIKFIGSRV